MKALQVGITGGIGSGKSYIAAQIEKAGYPVYYADERAKYLLNEDISVRRQILELFGEDIIAADGKPDRKAIAARVFSAPGMLQQLNAILHPPTLADHEAWVKKHTESPLLFKEAAILFESGSYKMADAVLLVYAPRNLRIRRVMQRDQLSANEVNARMERQWPEEMKMRLSDFILYNDDVHSAESQLNEALRFFLRMREEKASG